jgi:HEAT repeat protein
MIYDPHPNVICQAFYALGELGRPAAIDPIKQRLVELSHWYAQWYAYGALRKLGWQQTRSN